jgi:hypothetical protein
MPRKTKSDELPPAVDGAADEPMTAAQADTLRRLAIEAYEPEAFRARISRDEARRRIAALTAKLKLMDGPPHTL